MLRAVLLLQLTLWAATIHAFYPFFPTYLCSEDNICPGSAKRSVEGNAAPRGEGGSSVTFTLSQIRAPDTGEAPEARAGRAARYLKRKYSSIERTRTVKPAPDLTKRSNQYSVVSAAVPTQTNSVGVDQDGTDFSYFIQTYFGSNKTPIYMLLDTGAGTTWVMGTSCQSTACGMHNSFGPADSKTYQPSEKTFSIAYGSGSVSGQLATDVIAMADLEVTMSFGVANVTSNDFNYFPFDAILGLSMSTGATDNFMQVVKSAKMLTSNIFAVSLSRNSDGPNTGEITFGGTDASKFVGQISYTAVSSEGGGDWAIPMGDFAYGGKDAGITGRLAYLDTGTSYCFGPASDVAAIHKLIPGAASSDGVTYTAPCTSNLTLTVSFSGVSYTISSKDWLSAPSSSGVCTSNIYGHEVVDGSWLLGDLFLKNVYAVFDADKVQIGLASKPAAPSSSGSSSATATSDLSSTRTGLITPVQSDSSVTLTSTTATAVAETAGSTATATVSPGEQLEGNRYVSIICIIAVIAMVA